MSILEQMKKVLAGHPSATSNPEELARLQRFFMEMKRAGVARTREYDLPRPDTIGRIAVGTRRKVT
jgi:hypothetical protein